MRRFELTCAAMAAVFILAGSLSAVAQHSPAPPAPANCRNTASFEHWLADFRKEAAAAGISRATLARALDGITLDSSIISRDRKQGFFFFFFLSFSDKLISANRLQNGAARLRENRDLFARVEKEYGVPGPVIAAFWALESDFGGSMGKVSVLRSLATLAYDCRRPDMFRVQLMDALRIVDRGDLVPEEMIGSWAGELGQTQFLPSHYLQHAVETGIPGLFALLFLCLTVARRLVAVRFRDHLLMFVAAYLVAGAIQFTGVDAMLWLAYGLQSGVASGGPDA